MEKACLQSGDMRKEIFFRYAYVIHKDRSCDGGSQRKLSFNLWCSKTFHTLKCDKKERWWDDTNPENPNYPFSFPPLWNFKNTIPVLSCILYYSCIQFLKGSWTIYSRRRGFSLITPPRLNTAPKRWIALFMKRTDLTSFTSENSLFCKGHLQRCPNSWSHQTLRWSCETMTTASNQMLRVQTRLEDVVVEVTLYLAVWRCKGIHIEGLI